MNKTSVDFTITRIDMVEIEKRARQLRAEAIQNWFKSFKVVLSGYGFGVRGRPSNA